MLVLVFWRKISGRRGLSVVPHHGVGRAVSRGLRYIRLIGARLLLEAEGLLRRRGIGRAFLLRTDWNTAAQVFYERHGYHWVGALSDWLQDGVSELIYVKRDLLVASG